MAEKQIAWASGEGYIIVTFGGDGNGSVSVVSDANDSFDAREQQITIRTLLGSPERVQTVVVRQKGKTIPVGTVLNFEYTGGVQEVTLPKGKYKLQCWGAQGGSVSGTYSVSGSKGGYSEGVITLSRTTTFYIFVGGQGTSYTSSNTQTSTSVVNGGWNGGGAGVRTSRYNSDSKDGRSFPRGGGGATDIALVSSSMSYSSGRTNRTSASLLSRFIVAGGGAGASARYTVADTTTTTTVRTPVYSIRGTANYSHSTYGYYNLTYFLISNVGLSAGDKIGLDNSNGNGNYKFEFYSGSDGAWTYISGAYNKEQTVPSGCARISVLTFTATQNATVSANVVVIESVTTGSTSTDSSKSSTSMQGGGTSGKGQYPGTQSSGGSGGGAFGLGANQTATNYRYCAGGGGGGWYGGGTSHSDSSASYISYSGGGSGFVNTSSNSSYRPSGYTGLQLDSGSTTAGNSSHPSTSGGTETGHSGSGYAKITVLG